MKTRNLKESEIKNIVKKVKILLITAAEPEKKALLNAMKPLSNQREILKVVGKKTAYHIGRLGLYPVAHVHCKNQGSAGSGGSMLAVTDALNEIKGLNVCIMVGIAYYDNKEFEIHHGIFLCSEKLVDNDRPFRNFLWTGCSQRKDCCLYPQRASWQTDLFRDPGIYNPDPGYGCIT